MQSQDTGGKANFNPLPPCGGRQNKHFVRWRQIYFNPLPPCGGRPDKCDALEHFQDFNPLPPCGGRLVRFCPAFCIRSAFQSTPSVWRETAVRKYPCTAFRISIHSLRVEGDGSPKTSRAPTTDFNPLPPCGGRHAMYNTGATLQNFNPLPPCGGRHYGTFKMLRNRYFNPLPPCGGRRMTGWSILKRIIHFNPLPPCGGRRTHLSS